MTFTAGANVRHRSRLDWGVGKVEGTNGESVFVRFGDQLKTIKNAFAEQFLELVSDAELEAAKPAERAGPAVGRIAQCPECGRSLMRGSDGQWRPCLHCA